MFHPGNSKTNFSWVQSLYNKDNWLFTFLWSSHQLGLYVLKYLSISNILIFVAYATDFKISVIKMDTKHLKCKSIWIVDFI
jgi:hypothetical protein